MFNDDIDYTNMDKGNVQHIAGENWRAKMFISLLIVILIGLVDFIIMENGSLTDLDPPVPESRYSEWIITDFQDNDSIAELYMENEDLHNHYLLGKKLNYAQFCSNNYAAVDEHNDKDEYETENIDNVIPEAEGGWSTDLLS